MQCQAINKGNGNQCKRNAESESFFCKAHAALASQPLFTIVDAEASAPASQPEASAPIIAEDVTMSQPASQPEAKKDNARKGYESRQRAKRQAIASSAMSSQQKETARILLARESEASAPIINMEAKRDDETIMAFDLALAAGDSYVRAIKPADYDSRPRWLDEKTWKKARRAFNTLYSREGVKAFEKDSHGRLIMPLPMTPARYMGAVIVGDISTVLRYAGGWRESDDGTFAMLAKMDGVAPIIASVYRAGATLNRASLALDKAQAKLDSDPAGDGLTTKRDMARVARDVARDSFVRIYMEAIASAESLDRAARESAGAILAQFASQPESEDVNNTDLVA